MSFFKERKINLRNLLVKIQPMMCQCLAFQVGTRERQSFVTSFPARLEQLRVRITEAFATVDADIIVGVGRNR